jgi:hypothetical protein
MFSELKLSRLLKSLGAAAMVALAVSAVVATGAQAGKKAGSGGQQITTCPANAGMEGEGTPKIDVEGDLNNLYVEAPSGYLIDAYCVKAGTETTFVSVTPPKASIYLTAPGVKPKDISHYSLHFVPETREGEWCSPGFWRNNANQFGASQWPVPTDTNYNQVIDPDLAPKFAGATLLDVLNAPNTYGGAAFNAVGTYLSTEAGLNVVLDENGDPVHNCTLSQQPG